jgi:two-component system cell cycle sensor histidine kinase/response regulator CckA
MPEGGTIKITSENVTLSDNSRLSTLDEGKYIKLCIQDSGIGMPANVLEKIFDPYFSTKDKGSGLGLAISYSIINKHWGDMVVESTPGIGTTFTIYLPATDKAESEKQEITEANKSFHKAKVLIMDDDEMVRDVVNEMLTKLGHEVILASEGKEAIKSYKESINLDDRFDLVIMDLTIPGGMGGKEAVQEVLKLDKDAKVIVSSGYYNDPIMANYKDYGFCSAIGKPFDLSKLVEVIGQVFN